MNDLCDSGVAPGESIFSHEHIEFDVRVSRAHNKALIHSKPINPISPKLSKLTHEQHIEEIKSRIDERDFGSIFLRHCSCLLAREATLTQFDPEHFRAAIGVFTMNNGQICPVCGGGINECRAHTTVLDLQLTTFLPLKFLRLDMFEYIRSFCLYCSCFLRMPRAVIGAKMINVDGCGMEVAMKFSSESDESLRRDKISMFFLSAVVRQCVDKLAYTKNAVLEHIDETKCLEAGCNATTSNELSSNGVRACRKKRNLVVNGICLAHLIEKMQQVKWSDLVRMPLVDRCINCSKSAVVITPQPYRQEDIRDAFLTCVTDEHPSVSAPKYRYKMSPLLDMKKFVNERNDFWYAQFIDEPTTLMQIAGSQILGGAIFEHEHNSEDENEEEEDDEKKNKRVEKGYPPGTTVSTRLLFWEDVLAIARRARSVSDIALAVVDSSPFIGKNKDGESTLTYGFRRTIDIPPIESRANHGDHVSELTSQIMRIFNDREYARAEVGFNGTRARENATKIVSLIKKIQQDVSIFSTFSPTLTKSLIFREKSAHAGSGKRWTGRGRGSKLTPRLERRSAVSQLPKKTGHWNAMSTPRMNNTFRGVISAGVSNTRGINDFRDILPVGHIVVPPTILNKIVCHTYGTGKTLKEIFASGERPFAVIPPAPTSGDRRVVKWRDPKHIDKDVRPVKLAFKMIDAPKTRRFVFFTRFPHTRPHQVQFVKIMLPSTVPRDKNGKFVRDSHLDTQNVATVETNVGDASIGHADFDGDHKDGTHTTTIEGEADARFLMAPHVALFRTQDGTPVLRFGPADADVISWMTTNSGRDWLQSLPDEEKVNILMSVTYSLCSLPQRMHKDVMPAPKEFDQIRRTVAGTWLERVKLSPCEFRDSYESVDFSTLLLSSVFLGPECWQYDLGTARCISPTTFCERAQRHYVSSEEAARRMAFVQRYIVDPMVKPVERANNIPIFTVNDVHDLIRRAFVEINDGNACVDTFQLLSQLTGEIMWRRPVLGNSVAQMLPSTSISRVDQVWRNCAEDIRVYLIQRLKEMNPKMQRLVFSNDKFRASVHVSVELANINRLATKIRDEVIDWITTRTKQAQTIVERITADHFDEFERNTGKNVSMNRFRNSKKENPKKMAQVFASVGPAFGNHNRIMGIWEWASGWGKDIDEFIRNIGAIHPFELLRRCGIICTSLLNGMSPIERRNAEFKEREGAGQVAVSVPKSGRTSKRAASIAGTVVSDTNGCSIGASLEQYQIVALDMGIDMAKAVRLDTDVIEQATVPGQVPHGCNCAHPVECPLVKFVVPALRAFLTTYNAAIMHGNPFVEDINYHMYGVLDTETNIDRDVASTETEYGELMSCEDVLQWLQSELIPICIAPAANPIALSLDGRHAEALAEGLFNLSLLAGDMSKMLDLRGITPCSSVFYDEDDEVYISPHACAPQAAYTAACALLRRPTRNCASLINKLLQIAFQRCQLDHAKAGGLLGVFATEEAALQDGLDVSDPLARAINKRASSGTTDIRMLLLDHRMPTESSSTVFKWSRFAISSGLDKDIETAIQFAPDGLIGMATWCGVFDDVHSANRSTDFLGDVCGPCDAFVHDNAKKCNQFRSGDVSVLHTVAGVIGSVAVSCVTAIDCKRVLGIEQPQVKKKKGTTHSRQPANDPMEIESAAHDALWVSDSLLVWRFDVSNGSAFRSTLRVYAAEAGVTEKDAFEKDFHGYLHAWAREVLSPLIIEKTKLISGVIVHSPTSTSPDDAWIVVRLVLKRLKGFTAATYKQVKIDRSIFTQVTNSVTRTPSSQGHQNVIPSTLKSHIECFVDVVSTKGWCRCTGVDFSRLAAWKRVGLIDDSSDGHPFVATNDIPAMQAACGTFAANWSFARELHKIAARSSENILPTHARLLADIWFFDGLAIPVASLVLKCKTNRYDIATRLQAEKAQSVLINGSALANGLNTASTRSIAGSVFLGAAWNAAGSASVLPLF